MATITIADDVFLIDAVREYNTFWTFDQNSGIPIWKDKILFHPEEGDPVKILYGATRQSDRLNYDTTAMEALFRVFGVKEFKAGTYQVNSVWINNFKVKGFEWYGVTENNHLIVIAVEDRRLKISDEGISSWTIGDGGLLMDVTNALGLKHPSDRHFWEQVVWRRPDTPKIFTMHNLKSGITSTFPLHPDEELIEGWLSLFEQHLETL